MTHSLPDRGGSGSGSELSLAVDSLVSAAAGIRRIIDEVDVGAALVLHPDLDAMGASSVSGALNHFAASWREGLSILTGDQLGIADALESTVEDIVGVDLDVAAALQHVNGDIP